MRVLGPPHYPTGLAATSYAYLLPPVICPVFAAGINGSDANEPSIRTVGRRYLRPVPGLRPLGREVLRMSVRDSRAAARGSNPSVIQSVASESEIRSAGNINNGYILYPGSCIGLGGMPPQETMTGTGNSGMSLSRHKVLKTTGVSAVGAGLFAKTMSANKPEQISLCRCNHVCLDAKRFGVVIVWDMKGRYEYAGPRFGKFSAREWMNGGRMTRSGSATLSGSDSRTTTRTTRSTRYCRPTRLMRIRQSDPMRREGAG